ncbi:39450_t:CDS:2, partial [Gigaspora margarita]
MVNTDPNRSLAVRVQQMLETYQETKQREWKCCGKSYDASQIVNHLNSDQCSKKEKPWTMIPEICRDGFQKFIQENDIQRVEVKTETTMVFEYGDKRRVEISVNNANLELVRDYYKDKYQNEVIAKEQAELAEIERLRTENIY